MPPRRRPPTRAPAAQGRQEQRGSHSSGWRPLWVTSPGLLSSGGRGVDRQCNQGISPLYAACYHGHLEVVRILLSAGALVDLASVDGFTLLYAACQNGHMETVRALLSAGAKVDLQTTRFTPLLMACSRGHAAVARALLAAGAKVDLQENRGRSALQVVCVRGHMEVVHVLLSAGVRADQRDGNGVTPHDMLPPALHLMMEQMMERVREERALAHIPSRGAASNMDPGAAAAADPDAASVDPGGSSVYPGDAAVDPGDAAVDPAHGLDLDKPAGNQLLPGSTDGGACSLEGSPGYLPAEGGGRAGSVRVRRLWGRSVCWDQAAGLWVLHVRALLLGRVPGEALAGGRPQGGMPTAA